MKVTAPKFRAYIPLFIFSFIIFLVSLHDGIMSYMAPVIVQDKLNDALLVGLVLSTSSLFGMFFDFIIAQFFTKKNYVFFMVWMLIFAIAFPLIFLFLPRDLAPFVFAMVVWSVYYELRSYSKFDFVHKFLPVQKNTEAWAIMTIFQSASYMLGPAVTVFLLTKNAQLPLYASLILTTASILLFFFFIALYGRQHARDAANGEKPKSFWKELKVLKVLTKRIWVLVIFGFTTTLLDVAFWTTGVLYAEQLRNQSKWGSLFLVFYCLPTLFVGWIIPYIFKPLGKKRTSFIAGILAGISLLAIGLTNNIFVILGLVLLTSIFIDVANILLFAVFEDYVTRLDEAGHDLVSIGQFSGNLAYTIGPIILGLIVKFWGFGLSFVFTGIILSASAIFALFTVPRKIKMPHQEIGKILRARK
jgi:MFS family permease